MQPLIIYLNERCLKDIPMGYQWETGTQKLCCVIDDFLKLRADAHIALPAGQWQADCGGLHFYERLKNAYPNKDSYRRLLLKIKSLTNSDVQLLHEVYWGGVSAHGLTLAEAIQSWAVSLFVANTVWTQPCITAQRYELDESNDNLKGPASSDIKHLSDTSHLLYWATEIRDWGAIVAQSCVLDKINGLSVVMYQGPKEHNPPHVHLLDKQNNSSLAKYRIDIFERIKGPPTWDTEMKIWITQYREQLLKSWSRCQQGGFPFTIER